MTIRQQDWSELPAGAGDPVWRGRSAEIAPVPSPVPTMTRRSAFALVGAGMAMPFVARPAFADDLALPDYQVTGSEITVSKELPIRRPGRPIPDDAGLLFFIQTNQSRDCIVYTARPREEVPLDPDDPIDVFWRRFSRQGERDELSLFERFFVFGARAKPLEGEKERFAVRLAADADARGVLEIDGDGKPQVLHRIGEHVVKAVYAYAEVGKGFIPYIYFIDIIGQDIATGEFVTRRVKVGTS